MQRHDAKLTRKRIALAGGTNQSDRLTTFTRRAMFLAGMIGGIFTSIARRLRTGVEVKFILVDGLVDPDSVVSRVYKDFLPRALEQRQFVPAPPPQIVGQGLDKIQDALDLQRKGVSGRKIVVTL
jgi:hypothetical protein